MGSFGHCVHWKPTLSNIYFNLVLVALELKVLNHMLSTCSKCQREQRGVKSYTLTDKEKVSD